MSTNKALMISIIGFIYQFFAFSQEHIIHAEDFLLNQESDSAIHALIDKTVGYAATLNRLANHQITNEDLIELVESVDRRSNPDYAKLSQFIEQSIQIPDKQYLEFDYVFLRWLQITFIRNELLDVERSSKLNQDLKNYIHSTKADDAVRTRAEIYATLHDIVVLGIESNLTEGIPLCVDSRNKATKIGDTTLIIATYNLENDLIIHEGRLDEYIANARISLELDRHLSARTMFYANTMTQLINALIYKGGHQEEVFELLSEFYRKEEIRSGSYWLFLQFLISYPTDQVHQQKIFQLFEVDHPVALCSRLRELAAGHVNNLKYIEILRESGKYLADLGYSKESKQYFMEALFQNRQVYSEKLSRTLANYEGQLLEQEKEAELIVERAKTRLYIIIAILVSSFLVISVALLYRMFRISEKLKITNHQVSEQRDQIQEKESQLENLLNELNHRVKNNFQMIINLMELQSIELNDLKAQTLARELQNRIKSMAIIHQQLLQHIGSTIDFKQYLSRLIEEIVRTYSLNKPPKMTLDIANCSFGIDTSIPVGLITNELITNAFKYGLTEPNSELFISLQVTESGIHELTVADNGKGLPADFDFDKTQSMGIKLIRRLSQQLHGEFIYKKDQMNKFIVRFIPVG